MRYVVLVLIAVVIAHCGDNGDPNDSAPTPRITVTSIGSISTPTPASSPGPACPSAVSFEADAPTSLIDAGWTGLAHGTKNVDRAKFTFRIGGCDRATPPCGVCTLTNLIPNADREAGTSDNQRCTGDTSKECTRDADCGGDGPCAFFIGSPLAVAAGGVATCVTNQVIGTATGTIDLDVGTIVNTLNLRSVVHSAGDQSRPCPACVGDPIPEDGQRGGTCADGARAGLSCDVSGASPVFGPSSFDCPPLRGAELAALPITLRNSTGTTTQTLSTESPDCSAGEVPPLKCFCSTCATAAAEPCSTNADCPSGTACGGFRCAGGSSAGTPCTMPGAGECPGGGICVVPGQRTMPNQCDDGLCVATVSDPSRGECQAGPFEQFCGPRETFRGCSGDRDCTFAGDTCSTGKFRPCYLDNGAVGGSVSAIGRPDAPVDGISRPTVGGLFCIGPTIASAVNSAIGLPGLGRLTVQSTTIQIP